VEADCPLVKKTLPPEVVVVESGVSACLQPEVTKIADRKRE
jgi:hypothetical protein